jgi:hypothetical protein
MALTQNEIDLLLAFQRAKFAHQGFYGVRAAKIAFDQASENLKQIKDPVVAKLVEKFLKPNPTKKTRTGFSPSMKIAEESMLAEKELYEMSFQFGDNIPTASEQIQ